MAVHGIPHLPPVSGDPTDVHTRVAVWAVGLAVAAVGVMVAGAALLGISVLVGGADAVEDTWVGALGADVLFLGLATSAIAFATALWVRLRHEAWTRLWLPLVVFPALTTLLLLGEAFLWE